MSDLTQSERERLAVLRGWVKFKIPRQEGGRTCHWASPEGEWAEFPPDPTLDELWRLAEETWPDGFSIYCERYSGGLPYAIAYGVVAYGSDLRTVFGGAILAARGAEGD